MMGRSVVGAIAKRDLRSWFTSPTGYVFITVFVLLCAFAQFIPAKFFQENTASLGSLAEWFRYLLLFFVPAVTMLVWAGERSRGTDEILLTLPASDLKIVLGKFLAAAAIYTVSLLFTFLLPLWLSLLGDPDWGLILSTYLAFWCLGVLLISVGMVGSQLTDNLTVAFILGAVFCAVVVFAEALLGVVFPSVWRGFFGYGPIGFFEEMVGGLVTLKAIVFFAGCTAAFLYLNLVLLSRGRSSGAYRGVHFAVRAVAVFVAFIAATVVAGRSGARADLTSESLHSLSAETSRVLDGLKPTRPVTIRAWISPDVPRDYVPTRRELIDLLREYDARGGDAVSVEVIEAVRYQKAAREAEANFGITHKPVSAEEGSRRREFDLYMGVAVTCGPEEVVIPFLDKGLSVEYELTRSIRVVAGGARRKIGLLPGDSSLQMFGGFDMRMGGDRPDWELVRELKLQYEVVQVDPDMAYPDDLDVLIAILPSALTQPQMDRLQDEIHGGLPTLILDDPFPNVATQLVPTDPKPGGRRNPMTGQPMDMPEQKGDIRAFLMTFGIGWDPSMVAWQSYNPHPTLQVPQEFVFVSVGSGANEPFNPREEISSGLQELLFWVGGAVRESVPGAGNRSWITNRIEGLLAPFGDLVSGCMAPATSSRLHFVPLLTTSRDSGLLSMSQLFRNTMMGGRDLDPRRPHIATPDELILACRVTGPAISPRDPAEGDSVEASSTKDRTLDLVFVADVDLVNLPDLWMLRREGSDEFNFDNVPFILNCVDVLAGDQSFLELRKRRPRDRTLTTIEEQEAEYRRQWLEVKRAAERDASSDLAAAEMKLDEKEAEIRSDPNLDERAKNIRISEIRKVEQRRYDMASSAIEEEKERRIDEARGEMDDNVEKIQNRYRFLAVGISPVPAILVGLLIFLLRWNRERISIPEIRSVRGGI